LCPACTFCFCFCSIVRSLSISPHAVLSSVRFRLVCLTWNARDPSKSPTNSSNGN
jgi:hypothetical protein